MDDVPHGTAFAGARHELVHSADGTAIACAVTGDGRPLVLVHGTAADHTTFRAVEPLLRPSFTCWSMDRRGRGASGDRRPYSIEREFEDVAAVATAAADGAGTATADVFGHSYGGRCALGAALRSARVGRLIAYEGAPGEDAAVAGEALAPRLEALAEAGRPDELLRVFMREVVGMTEAELAAYEVNAVWPARVEAAGTIPRELRSATGDPAAGVDALSLVDRPVLLLAGDAGPTWFRAATERFAARLPDARVVILAGQKHAAHHTDPHAVVAAIRSFLLG